METPFITKIHALYFTCWCLHEVHESSRVKLSRGDRWHLSMTQMHSWNPSLTAFSHSRLKDCMSASFQLVQLVSLNQRQRDKKKKQLDRRGLSAAIQGDSQSSARSQFSTIIVSAVPSLRRLNVTTLTSPTERHNLRSNGHRSHESQNWTEYSRPRDCFCFLI